MTRSVDVIVGLQYGSEGKGAVAHRLAWRYDAAVRVGAPNAGHTIWHEGKAYKMRSVPCAWVKGEDIKLYVGPGGMINPDVLQAELETLPEYVKKNFFIDKNCGVITHQDVEFEEQSNFNAFNGSTAEGVGSAQARKVMRKDTEVFREWTINRPQWAKYCRDVTLELHDLLERNGTIMLEGTQGFGLSLNHGQYPYVTSRDVTTAAILNESGFSPFHARHVIGVMRTYPIRVAGHSGPMGAKELTWEEVSDRSGYTAKGQTLIERTTVTNRVRRVSEVDWDMLDRAVKVNGPTGIVITFMDYINANDAFKSGTGYLNLSEESRSFIYETEDRLRVPVVAVTTGPKLEDVVWGTEVYAEIFGNKSRNQMTH